MGTMKIILKQDIPNLGEEGDLKIVKRGYARNFLIPKKLVLDYSKKNINFLESKKDYLEKKRLEKRNNSEELKQKLQAEKITITVAAGDKGRLYGTVTSLNIMEELNKLGYHIDKKNIELKDHIKFQGNYKYRIHLYHEIYAEMELTVVGKQEKPKENAGLKRKKRRYSHKGDFEQGYDEAHADSESISKDIPETTDEASVVEDKSTETQEEVQPQE